ncbi:hypothetical protein RRG08_021330 [Elysia crispata]|uniref:Uncharacterized protein n=1 Tax=Elysia crispata TaxID=231223 RepID=A0AAE1CLN5_9GAST|nr:hypothetical protein RRG08_021330 [Elysia crispata]
MDNSCSHWSRNPSRPSPHPLDAVSLRYSLHCSGWTIPVATGEEILAALSPPPRRCESQILPTLFRVDNSCSQWSRNPSCPSPHPLDAVSLRYSLNCTGWTIPVASGQEILPAPLPTPSTLVDNSCSQWSRNPSCPSPHPLDAVSLRYSLNCTGWAIFPEVTGQGILLPLPDLQRCDCKSQLLPKLSRVCNLAVATGQEILSHLDGVSRR